MTISSRTPEGPLQHCPVCGRLAAIENSPQGDACCPSCGHLLWWFRDRLRLDSLALDAELIADLGLESIELVELVMELEEGFDIEIPDDAAQQIRTVADVIRYLRKRGEG